MFNNKLKALTFSYDDGVTQDIRLLEILNKYGLKATFNLNSELFGKKGTLERDGVHVKHDRLEKSDVKSIYQGHEIAVHTLTHKNLTQQTEEDVIYMVEQDRLNLSDIFGYEIVGMAYPCGGVNNDDRTAEIIRKNTGVKYARTISSTHTFDMPQNMYRLNPSVYHIKEAEKMFELGRKFLELKPDKPQMLYIWGHSYEFDINDTWSLFEEFCALMSGHDDIFYGTNKDILL